MHGLDCVKDSLAVRQRIGYLPESTPLYTEMRVDDYLRFVAEIRGVRFRERKAAIARSVQLCGLERVIGKNISELSKGYKQRVGLAQAIVHEPPVLILDEPTSGLDPNQIVEVRKLIERLGQEHTVVLSTHYLQEVEKSCTRVIIVNQGEIVADGTKDELVAQQPAGGLSLCVRGPEPQVMAQFRELLPSEVGVDIVERDGDAIHYLVAVGRQKSPLDESLARLVVKNGWDLLSMQRQVPSLEDAFRALTLEAQKEALDA